VALERGRSESRLHIGVGANNEKLFLFLGQVLVPRLVRLKGFMNWKGLSGFYGNQGAS
jgi:hypothetical protein